MSITPFPNGISSFGNVINSGWGVGNVYLVCQSAQTTVWAEMNKKYGKLVYSDGSRCLHSTIATALSACVTERNDYVVLMPDNDDYDHTTTLTINKKSVHLICPANLGPSVGTMNNARVHNHSGTSSHAITVTAGGVEVGGIYCKTSLNKYGIHIVDSADAVTSCWGLWIHNNTVVLYTAASSADGGIIGSGDGLSYSVVENNKCMVQNTTSHPIIIGTVGSSWAVIKKNLIISAGTGNTTAAAINLGTSNICHCSDNEIFESGLSTITVGIAGNQYCSLFDNRIGITDMTNAITGTETDVSAVSNLGGVSGGSITL